MKRKVLAREFLILLVTIFFIGTLIIVWSLLDTKSTTSKEGFRMEIYQNMTDLQLKDEFKKIIDIEYPDNFVRLLENPEISKRFYDKAKSLELYKWNHKLFTIETLKEKYGDSLEEKIEKYQFRKVQVITALDYPDFREKIEQDLIFNQQYNSMNNQNLYSFVPIMTSKRIAGLIISILIIVYPIRFIVYLTKWSIREIKN